MRIKIFLGSVFIILLSIIAILYLRLLSHDISMQSLVQKPSYKNSVYVVSYAEGADVYIKNQNAMTMSAINKGIDGVFNYHKKHLDAAWAARHSHILDQPQGAGYWLWKPWIILDALNKIPENSVLIYGDSNTIFKRPVHELVELANKHEIILIEHPVLSREEETQISALKALNCNSLECRQGRNVVACFIILKNTQKSRKLIAEWLSNCEKTELLIDDYGNSPNLKTHKHDQSILGVLAYHYRNDIKLLKYKFIRDNYIATAYRKPGISEFYTQNAEIFRYTLLGRVEYFLSNATPFVYLRKFVVTQLKNFPWRSSYLKDIDVENAIVNPI